MILSSHSIIDASTEIGLLAVRHSAPSTRTETCNPTGVRLRPTVTSVTQIPKNHSTITFQTDAKEGEKRTGNHDC